MMVMTTQQIAINDRVRDLITDFEDRIRSNHHKQGQIVRNEMIIELFADVLMRIEALEARARDDAQEEDRNQNQAGHEIHLRQPEIDGSIGA